MVLPVYITIMQVGLAQLPEHKSVRERERLGQRQRQTETERERKSHK